MLKRRLYNFGALALTLTVTPLLLGCPGDDPENGGNGGTGPNASAFVGAWNATTFVADGTDVVAGGAAITFTFTETEYSFAVSGDTSGFFCDTGVTACGDNGDISSSATTITFDPGTEDEVTLTYNVTGDVLTISGTIDGETLTATLQRI